ncbi:hypothetical protein GGF48_005256 [Coemansia sp. RSA 921]|nr:hypothetical protein LPJ69_004531 [Coemansia sp. RSA 1752]KAJ2112999.1 hypothetical protein GGF48_005256 [Coemansia sp. RSA 921]KAJ2436834.1 hypothetical protein IWW46_005590 [Coemansia sp. RSA 2440]
MYLSSSFYSRSALSSRCWSSSAIVAGTDAKRLYAFNLQHVRVQNKRESAAMLSNYNNLMTLYRRKCEVVDKHTRAAAQIKVNFWAFGSEIRAVAEDRDDKTQEIEYLRALLSE